MNKKIENKISVINKKVDFFRTIMIPIFDYTLYLCVSKKIPSIIQGSTNCTGCFLPDMNLIWLKDNEGLNINTIAHESTHIVCDVLAEAGIKTPDEETVAYLVGFIASEINSRISSKYF